jgi:hypothetical protein
MSARLQAVSSNAVTWTATPQAARRHAVVLVSAHGNGIAGGCPRTASQAIASLAMLTSHACRASGRCAARARHAAELAGAVLGKGTLAEAVW